MAKYEFVLSVFTRMQLLDLLLLQATAEQIRLAQMISDHNDADFEEKVKQVSRCASFCPTSAIV